MLTSELPEHCPCGGWPGDLGDPIPEMPGYYNHNVVTHKVDHSGRFWTVVADLPRIKTEAERIAEKAIKDRARKRWAEADRVWRRLWNSPNEAFQKLVMLHQPTLSEYDKLRCSFCVNEWGQSATHHRLCLLLRTTG
jgi:hypothetical protein